MGSQQRSLVFNGTIFRGSVAHVPPQSRQSSRHAEISQIASIDRLSAEANDCAFARLSGQISAMRHARPATPSSPADKPKVRWVGGWELGGVILLHNLGEVQREEGYPPRHALSARMPSILREEVDSTLPACSSSFHLPCPLIPR